jgi:hypothetical protein
MAEILHDKNRPANPPRCPNCISVRSVFNRIEVVRIPIPSTTNLISGLVDQSCDV